MKYLNYWLLIILIIGSFQKHARSQACATSVSPNITTTETWETLGDIDDELDTDNDGIPDKDAFDQIIIQDGGELTIRDLTVEFTDGGSIVVRTGGQLIIENCTLNVHSNCDEWAGIEVQGATDIDGNSTGDQYSNYSNRTLNIGLNADMGYLEISKGNGINSIIANVGHSNPSSSNIEYAVTSDAGGIINLEDLEINDCQGGILMQDYLLEINDKDYENACRVVNCEINFDRRYSVLSDFKHHKGISLERVSGVVIESTNVLNNYSSNSGERGIGINADKSSFTLTKHLKRTNASNDKSEIETDENGCPKFETGASRCLIKYFNYGLKASLASTDDHTISLSYTNVAGNLNSIDIDDGVQHAFYELKVNCLSTGSSSFRGTGSPLYLISLSSAENFLFEEIDMDTDYSNVNIFEVNDCGDDRSEIVNSSFTGSGNIGQVGLDISGNCGNFVAYCSSFSGNDYDISMNTGANILNKWLDDGTSLDNGNTHGSVGSAHIENNSNDDLTYNNSTMGLSASGTKTVTFTNPMESACPVDYASDCSSWPLSMPNQEVLDFKVYPNPAGNWTTLEIQSNGVEDYHVGIFTLKGKLVHSSYASGQEQLDLSDLEPGVYLVRVSNSKGLGLKQLVIQ